MTVGRGKTCVLLILVLLAVASMGGYWFFYSKITAGEKKFATGQEDLVDGKISLEEGKDELEDGKQRLSEGKEEYQVARDGLVLLWTDKLLQGGRGFKKAREQIAEGERKIDRGEDKINAGEGRVDAGTQELRLGAERLNMALTARVACAAGVFLFSTAAIVLGLRWR